MAFSFIHNWTFCSCLLNFVSRYTPPQKLRGEFDKNPGYNMQNWLPTAPVDAYNQLKEGTRPVDPYWEKAKLLHK
jgi:hypothetical protein